MRRVAVLLIGISGMLLSSTGPAAAQWRYPFCVLSEWSALTERQLEEQGFEALRERMQHAANGVLRDTGRSMDIVITDCPLHGSAEITPEVLSEQFASMGVAPLRLERWYRLHMTSLLLEEMREAEVVHRAVTHACIVRTGIYDDRHTPWTDAADVMVIRCRIEAAERMGEPELARWLRRYLRE